MRIAFAFLAHSALSHPDGTISAVGLGIDTIHATEFPAAVPLITAVVKIEFDPSECGRDHVVEAIPLDPDGHRFANPLTHTVRPERNPVDPMLTYVAPTVLTYGGLALQKPGTHALSIVVDGQELASLPLRVVRAPASAPAAPGRRRVPKRDAQADQDRT
jgi:hypothetical protein